MNMGIKPQLGWILTGLLGLLLLSCANQLAAKSGYGLTTSPEKCFVLEKNQECEITIKLNWRVEYKDSYCLYRHDRAIPIHCWQQQNSGMLDYLLITNADTQFELRNASNNQLMHRVEVKLYKQVRQLKKRRRNPWSFY